MSTLLLSQKDVRGLLSMSAVIAAVEAALRDYAMGRARMPHKVYLDTDGGDFRAMPAALAGAAGMKWVCAYPGNPAKGLPNVMATLIYSDPATGYPLAVMDAMDITAYRTGATAAIASKYLARPDSSTLGLIGAGQQAYTQLMAHVELFRLNKVTVFDVRPAAVESIHQGLPAVPRRGRDAPGGGGGGYRLHPDPGPRAGPPAAVDFPRGPHQRRWRRRPREAGAGPVHPGGVHGGRRRSQAGCRRR